MRPKKRILIYADDELKIPAGLALALRVRPWVVEFVYNREQFHASMKVLHRDLVIVWKPQKDCSDLCNAAARAYLPSLIVFSQRGFIGRLDASSASAWLPEPTTIQLIDMIFMLLRRKRGPRRQPGVERCVA